MIMGAIVEMTSDGNFFIAYKQLCSPDSLSTLGRLPLPATIISKSRGLVFCDIACMLLAVFP